MGYTNAFTGVAKNWAYTSGIPNTSTRLPHYGVPQRFRLERCIHAGLHPGALIDQQGCYQTPRQTPAVAELQFRLRLGGQRDRYIRIRDGEQVDRADYNALYS